MIFVTVGTHEQQFDRLIKCVDSLIQDGIINEEVIMQIGYSTYEPKNCVFYKFLSWNMMQELNQKANIIITHGGPSSFIDVLRLGKTPIVVPRQYKFGEHVNDHQLEFTMKLKNRGENIIVIENIAQLKDAIINFDNDKYVYKSNNESFCDKLIELIKEEVENV